MLCIQKDQRQILESQRCVSVSRLDIYNLTYIDIHLHICLCIYLRVIRIHIYIDRHIHIYIHVCIYVCFML